ncbi:MAG TPA: glycosyltransferase, partial [Candidatus Saccharibacteria bacterium]|nr:glycosyltransferase [Candidatus Saccharibacteria bacterium]
MKSTPLISVILPIYNVDKYLAECIDSVMDQTYSNLEIILVNDGATDNSLSICKEYQKKDKRIKIVSKKNGGLNLARKSGYEISAGEWITFVDSDDVIDRNYIKYLLNATQEHNTQLSVCGFRNFTTAVESNISKPKYLFKTHETVKNMYLLDQSPSPQIFMQTAWGKLISRKIMSAVDWDFCNYKTNEDEFMSIFYYAASKEGVVFVDNHLYFYRQRSDSIMDKNQKEYVNYFNDKKLTRFDFLNEVFNKRLEKFGKKYIKEIAFWYTLHFIISASKDYSNKRKIISKREQDVFNRHLPEIRSAIKKYPLYGEHGEIIKEIFKMNSIEGLYTYKKNTPLISIIVPAFNAEKHLTECLESLVNQSYRNIEIIIVDDGSTDSSSVIYQKFSEADNRIRVIKKSNGGVSSARNAGMGAAFGDYLFFVDSDDFIATSAIETLAKAASK